LLRLFLIWVIVLVPHRFTISSPMNFQLQSTCSVRLTALLKLISLQNKDPLQVLGDLQILLRLRRADLKRYLSIMLWSSDGSIATVSNVAESVLTILPRVANTTLYPTDAAGKYFRKYQKIDIYREGSLVISTYVTAVDKTLGKITVNDATGVQANDVIYWKDTVTKAPCPGFPLIISKTGTYGTINRATSGNEYWHSAVEESAGGQNLTRKMMNRIFDYCQEQTDEEAKVVKIITTKNVRESYADLLTFTYNVNAGGGQAPKVNAGYKGMSFSTPDGREIPIEVDYLCPEGTMWFLSNRLYLYFARRFKWEETGKGGADRWWHYMGILSGENDIYRAMGSMNINTFSNHPASMGVIKDINTDVAAS
jgi:hypothetical protein